MQMAPKEIPARRDKALVARRRQILDAAMVCFLESGYHQTGVREIAARAGISLGNLYNHFPGKHDLLIEIARLEREELAPFIRQLCKPGPALKVLDGFVTGYAKYLSAQENVILTIEITSEAIRKPDLNALFNANRQELVEALAALLQRGVELDEMRLATDRVEAAQMVLELIEARAFHSVLSDLRLRRLLPGLRSFLRNALGVREG